jgi:hypothetical protein
MNMRSHLVYDALWIAHPVLQIALATVMFWRKQYRIFPVFFAYLGFQIVGFLVLFPLNKWGEYSQYFYSYWTLAAISVVLGFRVIQEIFEDVFRPYHTLKDLGTVLFKWAALVMLLVAGVIMAASPATGDPILQAIITLQRCVRVVQCGLILFLLIFSRYLGVSWRQQSFGVALGFGGLAGVELTLVALNASSHLSQLTLNLFNFAAYDLVILLWLAYGLIRTPKRAHTANILTSQRWEQGLIELQHPSSNDSLIPIFEGMVDRAFSRSGGPHLIERKATPSPSGTSSSSGHLVVPRQFASKI